MKEAFIKTANNNGIATITFYHPQSNSLPSELLSKLTEEIEKAGKDITVRAILLKSEGDNIFCAGGSFDEMLLLNDETISKNFFKGFANVINAIKKAPKFVIARVQGKTVGGGVGIVAAADYAIATEKAAIKLSELSIGIGPFVIGPAVQRKVDLSAFSTLTINAKEWQTAQWALEKGLYNEIFKSTVDVDNAISKLSDEILKYNPEAMFELKKRMWAGTDDWDLLLDEQASIVSKLALSTFTKNALNKFKNDR